MLPTITFKIERWKFNKDYGIYVSTQGNFKDRYKRRLPIKINQKGYCVVKTDSGYKLAHRIVMLTWKPIPDAENLTVDHLDHNKRRNSIDNLEWVSIKVNKERAAKDFLKPEKIKKKYKWMINKKEFNSFEEAQEILKEIYPSGYSSATLELYIKNIEIGLNTANRKKIGKSALLERVEIA